MEQLIPTKQGQVTINGRKMDIVCSQFSGTLFLLISEYGKLGTLLEVTQDPAVVSAPSSQPSYSVRTLLGKDQPEVHVFGRALASHILDPSARPPHLLLSLGLTDHSPHILPPLLNLMDQYRPTS